MVAFIIWTIGGTLFIGLGIYDMKSSKTMPFGFWANAEVAPVKNVKAYNKALGKLFIVFGLAFILIGLPLLAGENSALIAIPIVGSMFLAIIAMGIYTVGIEGKYRK